MIEPHLWKQLVALKKYGTLSKAALSRSMKKLEQIIGGEFFVRIMLHACSLTFPHPVTGEIMCVEKAFEF